MAETCVAKKHRCPPRCHRCPDIIAITREQGADLSDWRDTIMPFCENGEHFGLSACCCAPEHPPEESERDRERNLAALRRLVERYPQDAARFVAAFDAGEFPELEETTDG